MPKDNIDYSNTIIYKIYCNNQAITDTYVGHTTNFFVRKHQHKNSCNNSKNVLKIYKTIRENGGWDNWNMIEIAKYNCNDSTEARIKEQQHFEELKSTLNSCPPYVDKKKYFCIDCNLQCNGPNHFNKHIKCNLHSTTKQIKSNEESKKIFTCDNCDFKCYKKSNYDNHLLTTKHKNRIQLSNLEPKNAKKMFVCEKCNKEYTVRNSLWYHEKKCNYEKEKDDGDNYYEGINLKDKDALVLHLLKQNGDLQKSLIELLNK
jgi:hypothetical protein